MDIGFKFSNLIGSAYKNGNLVFSPDGYAIYSPVGNKISIFDLKNNISRTLCIESNYNIVALDVNFSGSHLVAANEHGFIYYVNLITETVISTFKNGSKVKALKFSPEATHIAVCRDNDLQIFELSKFLEDSYHPFHIVSTHHIANDTLSVLDWSFDGKLIVCGGTDKIIRAVAKQKFKNFQLHCLGSHKGAIVNVQFLSNLYDLVSVDVTGFSIYWKCSLTPGELIEGDYVKPDEITDNNFARLYFEKTTSFSLIEAAGSVKQAVSVTTSDYHTTNKMLVTAFSNGVFVLHEIPSFALIHSLRISDISVSSAVFNNSGDWIALGCGKGSSAQLLIWEWQSETYILKQQAHSQRVTSSQFSPDGSLLVTGAEDGKVKVWNSRTSFCNVTFTDHVSSVTAVCWMQNGKAVLSASLDGTIRANDMKRYRNFRTLVCPEPTQFLSLAIDNRGDIVCATGKENYNIFVWSMESGRLIDILAGHQSNIASISIFGNRLASAGWDRSLRVWSIFNSSSENVELSQEALCVSFSPCGQLIAVLTLDSSVSFYGVEELTPVGTIEAKLDLDAGRLDRDVIKQENSQKNKSFSTMAFSPDSTLLILGGDSNSLCIYSVADRILLKKLKITQNRSFDGVVIDINKRNFSEFGNMKLFDGSDSDEELDHHKAIRLPGSKHVDLGERQARPEIAVFDVTFCPTGRRFSVCSSEGVGLYSLDTVEMFDPFHLEQQASPKYVKRCISLGDYTTALLSALKLNDSIIIQDVLEKTPLTSVIFVCNSLSTLYAEHLVNWMVSNNLLWNSPRINFYMIWIKSLLYAHGMKFKGRTDLSVLTGLQQVISHHTTLISKLAGQNRCSLHYLVNLKKSIQPKNED